MPDDEEQGAIEPGNGRILGAGSNSLQKSIDQLNYSVQRLMTSSSGSMGGGGGRPPAVISAASSAPEPQRPSSAVAVRTDRFPAPVSWDSNDTGGSQTYSWGTPQRTSQRASLPPTPQTGAGWVAAGPDTINKDNLNSSGGGGSSFSPSTARRWISRVQTFGNNMLKQALPMDNYAQFAAIQQGSPYGADGTNGGNVNSIRKYVFGSQNRNNIMWAQNSQDASTAAFTASRDSGYTALSPGTRNVNPQFSGYMGNIKDLSVLNPMMSAASAANTVGTLGSTRGLYASMMFGYQPVLGPGGQVNRSALGGFTDSVMRSAYGKTSVTPQQLTASLGQNGVLNSNINAYVNAAGGNQQTVQSLEDYITGRNTARQHGVSGTKFDDLLNTYESGGSAGKAAGSQLKKFGVTNSILQSQKDVSAASAQNTSDLLDSFGPAIKKANEALADLYDMVNKIVNIPGLKQLIGYTGAFGAVFGGAAGALVGGAAGFGAARVLGGTVASGTVGSLAARSGGAGARLAGAATTTAALGGAAVFLASAAGGEHWGSVTNKMDAFKQWEKESNNVPDIGKLKSKQFEADYNKFAKIWDQAQKSNTAGRTTGNDGVGGGAASAGAGGGGGSSKGSVVNGKTAAGAITSALDELGKPYAWGGTGPDSWDCSGLMQHAYGSIGVRIPRTSEQQMGIGEAIKMGDERPGDLMFPYPGHVVMYLGNGKIVEAPRTGENVRTASVNEYGKYAAIRRVVGAVGNVSGLDSGSAAQKPMADNAGGDAGSQVIGSGDYGSSEEVDTIQAALSSVIGAVGSTGQTASSSKANTVPSASTSGPWKKDSQSVQKAKALGKQLAAQMYNWTGGQWDALDKLWTGESGWRWWADNPSSHAYGIVQALPGSKMASAGKDWKTNPATQEKWGMKYIHDRYGDPINAYNTWSKRSPHWYNTGAWEIPNDQVAMVHKGEMVIEKPKADTIRNALMQDVVNVKSPSGSSAKSGGSGLTLVFNNGSVSFNVSGSIGESQAQSAAATFAQTLASDDRLKSLARGL